MDPTRIFVPMLALVFVTFTVLLRIPFVRIRAGRSRRIEVDDFKYGESTRVPPDVSIPNRNYMNLLEVPVLFYAVCLSFFVTRRVDETTLVLAWVYVALRAVHSLVHLTYNHVLHRLAVFATSNVVLLALWIRFARSIL
ncbi:MAG TPA: MAPEG family protein [Polyangiaceae bacterium]|jgi:hypothetical protein|nr:MAPEG family protein [Polyangiaceae bacterium]